MGLCLLLWQPLSNLEPEDKEHRLEIPICISGIGLLQILVAPFHETRRTRIRKTRMGTYCTDAHPFDSLGNQKKCRLFIYSNTFVSFGLHNVVFKSNHTQKLLRHY